VQAMAPSNNDELQPALDAETLVAMREAAKHAADMRAEAAVEAQYDL